MTVIDTTITVIDIDTITELKALVAEACANPNFELVKGQARKTILDVVEKGVTDSGHTADYIRGAIELANSHMEAGDIDMLQARVNNIVSSPNFDKVKRGARKTLVAAAEGIVGCGYSFTYVEGACNIAEEVMGGSNAPVDINTDNLVDRVRAIVSVDLFKVVNGKFRATLESVALNGLGDLSAQHVIDVCEWVDNLFADFSNAITAIEGELKAIKADPLYLLLEGRILDQIEAGLPTEYSSTPELTFKLRQLKGTMQFVRMELFPKFDRKIEAAKRALESVNKYPRLTQGFMNENPGVKVPTKVPAKPTNDDLKAIFAMADEFRTWKNSPSIQLGIALPGELNNGRHRVRRGKSKAQLRGEAEAAVRAADPNRKRSYQTEGQGKFKK